MCTEQLTQKAPGQCTAAEYHVRLCGMVVDQLSTQHLTTVPQVSQLTHITATHTQEGTSVQHKKHHATAEDNQAQAYAALQQYSVAGLCGHRRSILDSRTRKVLGSSASKGAKQYSAGALGAWCTPV
jgi:hypothetical protein